VTTDPITDHQRPRAFDLYLMLSAYEWMVGVVHDTHRRTLARRFAAYNFVRMFSHTDPFLARL